MIGILQSRDLPESISTNPMVPMWVDGANARAARVAPCLSVEAKPGPTEQQVAEARLVLVGAIMRWSEAGAGAVQTRAAGPYSETLDTRQKTGFNLWPSEITQLQDICKSGEQEKAYAVDTVASGSAHSPICSLYFGAGELCSCGATIAGAPLYE